MNYVDFQGCVGDEIDRMRVTLMAARPTLDTKLPDSDRGLGMRLYREADEALDVVEKKLMELAKMMPTAADRAAASA